MSLDMSPYKDKTEKIIGPPGTGKTTELMKRVKYVLKNDPNAKPNDIGFFSFTNFSVNVARSRIAKEFAEYDLQEDFGGFRTLHSLAFQSLEEGIELLAPQQAREFDDDIKIEKFYMDVDDPNKVVYRPKHIVIDTFATARSKQIPFRDYLGSMKNPTTLYKLEKWLQKNRQEHEGKIERLIRYNKEYEDHKKRIGVIDYTDLLERALSQDAKIPQYRYVFIDEAQDLSKLQWAFAQRLFENAEKIFLAGDEDQAICESFGASPDIFVEFPSKETPLPTSWRIPKSLHKYLHMVNGTIAKFNHKRTKKEWHPANKQGHTGYLSRDSLFSLLRKYPNKEWLIMSATHKTLAKWSTYLSEEGIRHYKSNEDIPSNNGFQGNQRPSIKLATVWGAKGGEADCTVLIRGDRMDKRMFDDERRLLYVGRTRARIIHIEATEFGNRDTTIYELKLENDVKDQENDEQHPTPNKTTLGEADNQSKTEDYPTLLDVRPCKRGKHDGIQLVLSNGTFPAKIFKVEETLQQIKDQELIGKRVDTNVANPKKNNPKEWFNEIWEVKD